MTNKCLSYPVAVEPGDENTAFGICVPDIEGCFSAGDTLEEALINAKYVIEFCSEDYQERGEKVPLPTDLNEWKKSDEFIGWSWHMVEVEIPETGLKNEK